MRGSLFIDARGRAANRHELLPMLVEPTAVLSSGGSWVIS